MINLNTIVKTIYWYIFQNIKYIPFTTFKRHLDNHINKVQIKRITPHGFRHSHVSLLIHLGCDSREVAERIGDTVKLVEETYYHMLPEKKSNPVKALNNFKNKKIRGKQEIKYKIKIKTLVK